MKIGVIGVGNMGRNHVRNIMELPNHYELIGCYDSSEQNLRGIHEAYGVRCFDSADKLLNLTEAVVLAVPSSLHRQYGVMSAEHKQHVLIEKPIALSETDGNVLCDIFNGLGKVLMVGHVERYNPVVVEMKKVLETECDIIAIDARRCSPFDKRIADTNVIFDLMIHDLDIVLNYIQPNAVKFITANAVIVKSASHSDYVQAIFQHETGAISTILASRVTEDKIRTIDIHTKHALIRGDLLNKTLNVIRKTSFNLDLGYTPTYKQENIVEKIILPNIEPLKAELIEFSNAIRENRVAQTNGKDAMKALHYAERINELTSNCPFWGN